MLIKYFVLDIEFMDSSVIQEKLKNLPEDSGVYVMLDSNKSIIYIGKARSLKNRVRQYFHSGAGFNEKTLAMVSRIHDFHYYITPTEADALALEANLVKKHKPPYNILLKDDKRFPYIRVNLNEQFPAFTVTRRVKKDGARYFGPYMGGVRVKEILDIINSAFGFRQCNLNFRRIPSKHRACLNYQIGKCTAPCTGGISRQQYMDNVMRACDFLSGKDSGLKALLTQKMLTASQREQYEAAAMYRDRIVMADKLRGDRVAALRKSVSMDIVGYRTDGRYGAVSMLFIRDGNMEGVQNFAVSDAGIDNEDTLVSFITQYYGGDVSAPEQLVCAVQQTDSLSRYLTGLFGRRVEVVNPMRGTKRRLLDMAHKNAGEYVDKYLENIKHREDVTLGAVYVLQRELALDRPPLRIECFDISHISGTEKAAAMSVFINGEKQPAHYRRFRVGVPGNDDYASISETVLRRLSRLAESGEQEGDVSFSQMPDLAVIDGGKGQLSAAYKQLKALGLDKKTEVIALAEREEEIFLPGQVNAVTLDRHSLGLKLLQRVRDEAHRFGIAYHRTLRAKRSTSELDQIPGIGKQRKRELLKHFKSVEGIKRADKQQLSRVKGISLGLADNIISFFSDNQTPPE